MKYSTHLISKLVFLISLYLIIPLMAYAYIDPGTGSYFLQLALGALIGVLFTVRLFWNKIKIFLKNLFSQVKTNAKN